MAMQTYLARGGGLVKNRKGVEVYADGPMKGMTQAQAEADFENKWAGASGAIKDKYSRKAGPDGVLSPSEKTALTPAMPKDMDPAAVQKRRMAQYGHEFAPDGSVRRIGTPERKTVNPAASPVDNNFAPGANVTAPADGFQPVGEFNPDGTSKSPIQRFVDKTNEFADSLRARANTPYQERMGAMPQPKPEPVGSRATNIAAGGQMATDDRMAAARDSAQSQAALERQFPGVQSKVVAPPVNPDVERQFPGVQGRATPSISPIPPMIARPEVRSREMVSDTLRRPAEATDGSPVVARPADVNGQRMDPAIAGNAGNKVRINSLTGLPFGYNPGDALPASADAGMQQRGRDSQTRQSVAAAGAPPPRATVVTPAPRPTALQQSAINRPRTVTGGVEGRAADEMRRQAGINANPSTVNPDDPKKFFTGRTLPLDQLVKRQTVSTPVRR